MPTTTSVQVPEDPRSQAFYDTTVFWQWMRMPGDIVFAAGALWMAWDFLVKLRPVLPRFMLFFLPASRKK